MSRVPQPNRRLVLEAPQRVPDGAGGWSRAWAPLGTLWGEFRASPGREGAEAGARVSRVKWRVVLRAVPHGHAGRPRPEQRLREGDRVFDVLAVAEHDREGRWLVAHVEEGVAA
ncbi:head-tail adaptor [Hasllibacter halocynthiae]|uniref:Head-tail adaptor n=1 Tax=Hasllibacter halocynthiae TaxID=595589 RepID=A0A2T0X8X1_9RHOB|nr:head-tail adaptor protein [Hasllibacter halocynthiae]PRY95367.1 head-tail adaptor [Hasllibacter halocynthiae]